MAQKYNKSIRWQNALMFSTPNWEIYIVQPTYFSSIELNEKESYQINKRDQAPVDKSSCKAIKKGGRV